VLVLGMGLGDLGLGLGGVGSLSWVLESVLGCSMGKIRNRNRNRNR